VAARNASSDIRNAVAAKAEPEISFIKISFPTAHITLGPWPKRIIAPWLCVCPALCHLRNHVRLMPWGDTSNRRQRGQLNIKLDVAFLRKESGMRSKGNNVRPSKKSTPKGAF
jgi:hypothetical protein